jgi:preprotein translocase subunit SecG
MLFGFLVFLFLCISFLMILVILIQKGSGGLGLGNIGGSNTMLFGGSGGQDIFQRITWIFAAFFMGGSLLLSIMKTQQVRGSRYLDKHRTMLPRTQQALPQKSNGQPGLPN